MSEDPFFRKVCIAVAPALLLATALLQAWRVEEELLHPWKGGGFGMFAHAPGHRALRVLPLGEDRTLYVTPVPSRYRESSDRILFRPGEARLRALARELLATEWRLVGGGEARHPVPEYDAIGHPAGEPVRIVGIRIELVAYRYDAESDELRAHPLLTVDEGAAGGGG